MLIENFAIKNLFGYQDFEISFKQKDNIFIGENGMGKTSILAILYHTLSLNFKELFRYDFTTIEIQYENSKKIKISHSQIKELLDFEDTRNHNILPPNIKRKIQLILDSEPYKNAIKSKEKFDSVSYIRRTLYKEHNTSVPASLITEITNRELFIENSNIKYFIDTTKRLENTKILYFPTYRRIEEDIENLDMEDDRQEFYYNKKRKFLNKSTGELIQFGMDDVEQTITNLLDTIKKNSIDSFNKMTSELLEQYAVDNLEQNELSQLSEQDIDISLKRVGDKIDSILYEKIMQLSKSGELTNFRYLHNLITNLVNKNKSLESIDNKIQEFVDKCNDYLYGKKFIYNPSEVTLNIQLESNNGDIKLSQLSSGEKQLVSTFSKVFLENNDNLIILFDEPELSLSIDWQKKFIYDIFNSDNSIFCLAVTHSPYIFQNETMFNITSEMRKYIRESDHIQ